VIVDVDVHDPELANNSDTLLDNEHRYFLPYLSSHSPRTLHHEDPLHWRMLSDNFGSMDPARLTLAMRPDSQE